MKKLMIAAAIAFAAVASQASTVSWTLTNLMDKSGEGQKAVSGVAYFFASDNYAYANVAKLANKGATAVAAAMTSEDNYGQAWTVSGGKAATFSASDRIDIADMGLEGNTEYDFYAVVFDTDTITEASHFYVTPLKESQKTATGTGNKVIGFGSQLDDTTLKGTWYSVAAVPEPTSGLLLLLGMAGLALKRKRA